MKVLFLFPYPLDESPSQRFRFEQYFVKLASVGITYSYYSFWDLKTWRILYKHGHLGLKILGFLSGSVKRFLVLSKVRGVDIVFIHRECLPIGPPLIEWIIAKIFRKKIIYDFDDAIWLPNTTTENTLASSLKWHSKVHDICKWSYKVSCGNAYLYDYARQYNTNVVLIPTTIDTNYHDPDRIKILKDEQTITIGWTGTHSTLKYLKSLVPIIKKLESQYSNIRFVVIANKKPELPVQTLTFIPWSKENEIVDLLKFDIGVMPLENDAWAQGKCGFKALQYMALGIPSLASPIGVNKSIIDHSVNGFLCNTPDEWYAYLCRLIEQPELRHSIGTLGRKRVIESYSVSSNSSRFVSLFD